MTRSGTLEQWAIGAAALVVGLVVAAASAQSPSRPNLSPDLRNAANLTDDQKKQIAAYVEYWSNQLLTDDRSLMTAAQDELLRPVEGATSVPFREAYGAGLGPNLGRLARHANPQARMAAMIVAGNVGGQAAAESLAAGLLDPHLGVRYFAGKGVADLFKRWNVVTDPLPFTDVQQQALLKALTEAMSKESSPVAFEQLGRALSALRIPTAYSETIKALRDRLQWYRLNPNSPPDSARAMMENLYEQLNVMEGTGQEITSQLRELTAAGGLYLAGAAELMGRDPPISEQARQSWGQLIVIIEARVFDRAIKKFSSSTTGPRLAAHVNRNAWGGQLGLDILTWIGKPNSNEPGILTTALGVSLDKLRLPPLPQAPAAVDRPAEKADRSAP